MIGSKKPVVCVAVALALWLSACATPPKVESTPASEPNALEPAVEPETPEPAAEPVTAPDTSMLPPVTDAWDPWQAWADEQVAPLADHVAPAEFMHVLHADGPIAIAGTIAWPESPDAPSESQWAALLLRYGQTTVHRYSPHAVILVTRLRPGATSRAARQLAGQRLQAFSANGEACRGKTAEPVEVLFLDHDMYEPAPDEPFDPWDELGSALAISDFLRNQGAHNRYVGLPLRTQDACADAIWARRAAKDTPRMAVVNAATAPETERAKRDLMDSAPSEFARALFHREGWGDPWSIEAFNLRRGASRHVDPATDPVVVRAVVPAEGKRWILAAARGGHHYCASPAVDLFRAWDAAGWKPLARPGPGSTAIPTAVIDVDNDGIWEILERGPGGATLHSLQDGLLIERTIPVTPHFWVSC